MGTLALCAACSANGVVGGKQSSGGGGPPGDTSGAGGASDTSSSAATGSDTSTDGASTTDSTGSATTGAGGAGGDDGTSTSGTGGTSSTGTGGDPNLDGGAEAGPTCNDDLGMPGACTAPPGDGGCASVMSYCQRLSTMLKPKVHAAVAACISALPACDDAQAARCVKTALFAACADPSSETSCGDVSRACASSVPTTVEECQQFLKGMTPAGRQAVALCLSPADAGPMCPAGVFACVRSL
jgi:hypothetical protein